MSPGGQFSLSPDSGRMPEVLGRRPAGATVAGRPAARHSPNVPRQYRQAKINSATSGLSAIHKHTKPKIDMPANAPIRIKTVIRPKTAGSPRSPCYPLP